MCHNAHICEACRTDRSSRIPYYLEFPTLLHEYENTRFESVQRLALGGQTPILAQPTAVCRSEEYTLIKTTRSARVRSDGVEVDGNKLDNGLLLNLPEKEGRAIYPQLVF